MDRIVLLCDCNNFFASCEMRENPALRDVPMAVAGDPERRTGVVVAKNELAKRFGVKTTDTVFAAQRKCPGIVFVPPRHELYARLSRQINAIYREYTDMAEPASIDESFLDATVYTAGRWGDARDLADELRGRVRKEIGITISVGVSFCRTFAKMASEMKKPDGTTVIAPGDVEEKIWPLPVTDMPFVGRSAGETLKSTIYTRWATWPGRIGSFFRGCWAREARVCAARRRGLTTRRCAGGTKGRRSNPSAGA